MLNLRTGIYEVFHQGRFGFNFNRILINHRYNKEHPRISSDAIFDALRRRRVKR